MSAKVLRACAVVVAATLTVTMSTPRTASAEDECETVPTVCESSANGLRPCRVDVGDCDPGSRCVVNVGSCEPDARCPVNVGSCRPGGECTINVGDCGDGESGALVIEHDEIP